MNPSDRWPTPDLFRDWLRSKKRPRESLLDTAHRMVVTMGYLETVYKGRTLHCLADWLDLQQESRGARATCASRLVASHELREHVGWVNRTGEIQHGLGNRGTDQEEAVVNGGGS